MCWLRRGPWVRHCQSVEYSWPHGIVLFELISFHVGVNRVELASGEAIQCAPTLYPMGTTSRRGPRVIISIPCNG